MCGRPRKEFSHLSDLSKRREVTLLAKSTANKAELYRASIISVRKHISPYPSSQHQPSAVQAILSWSKCIFMCRFISSSVYNYSSTADDSGKVIWCNRTPQNYQILLINKTRVCKGRSGTKKSRPIVNLENLTVKTRGNSNKIWYEFNHNWWKGIKQSDTHKVNSILSYLWSIFKRLYEN